MQRIFFLSEANPTRANMLYIDKDNPHVGPQKKRGGCKRGKFHPVRCWACLISINSFSVQLLRPATFWGTLEIFSSMLLFVPICPGELALYLYYIYAFECINQFLVPCVCLTILSAQSHESPEGGNASHTQNMYSENIQSWGETK